MNSGTTAVQCLEYNMPSLRLNSVFYAGTGTVLLYHTAVVRVLFGIGKYPLSSGTNGEKSDAAGS